MLTTADVADLLNRPVRTINHIAAEHGIGQVVSGRQFTEADVSTLRRLLATRKPGRPPSTKGNAMKRSGFTLVELMVVIVIIAILATLLLQAVSGAMATARTTEVVTDISTFESHITAFQQRYGQHPPSFVAIPEDASLWSSDWDSTPPVAGITNLHRRSSKALIRQLWPEFDFLYGGTTGAPGGIDINDDGDAADFLVLNGAECFVFFLGGIPDRVDTNSDGTDDSWNVVGFSANPQAPFTRGVGNRVGPFGNFFVSRFVDVDATLGINLDEKMPEYCDPLRNQRTPYQYLCGYETGSRPYGLDYDPATATNPSTADDELIPQPTGLEDGYWLSNSGGRPQYIPQGQIVSPGEDGDFGIGGNYNGSNMPPNRAAERDNIVNFKKGRLN